jgi:hypothetical protein
MNPVQVFRTLRDLHWEFLRLWTGFGLSSSCSKAPLLLCTTSKSKYFGFYVVASNYLGAQDLNGFNGQNIVSKSSWR